MNSIASVPPVVRLTSRQRRDVRRAARQKRQEELDAALATSGGRVRLGTIALRSAFAYLTVWSLVLFTVLLLVLCGGYLALARLGVIASLSRSLAVILSEPLPSSGVLPYLEPRSLVWVGVLASAVLSFLWLVSSLAFVLVHNAVSSLTGGLAIRLAELPPPPPAEPLRPSPPVEPLRAAPQIR